MGHMREAEWLLEYPGVSYSWGGQLAPGEERVGAYNLTAPAFGDPEITTDDTQRPRMDGTAVGADYRSGRTVTFELGIRSTTPTEVADRAAELARVWRADSIRFTPGSVASLTVLSRGQTRTMLGRPRRFSLSYATRHAGFLTAVCDFQTLDDVFYGDTETIRVNLVPPTSGGFTAPVVTPLTTIAPTEQSGSVFVLGDLPAVVVATVHGPIINPVVRITGQWSLGLNMTIPAGEAIALDARPWARTITRVSDGASFAGRLSRTSRLSRAVLPPGAHEAALTGTDGTGTAYMDLTWTTAHAALGDPALAPLPTTPGEYSRP